MIMNDDVENGLKQIRDAMIESTEFDSFLCVVGDIFTNQKRYPEARDTYQKYLENYPADYNVIKKLMDVLMQNNEYELADKLNDKYNSLKF